METNAALITHKNYKSYFDFYLDLLAGDKEIGWPAWDWEAWFYTTQPANAYKVSCIGGVCRGCFNDHGRIHVVCANHNIGKGRLKCVFKALLPDSIYPDGRRVEFTPFFADIVLWDGSSDDAGTLTVRASLEARPLQYIELVTDKALYRVPLGMAMEMITPVQPAPPAYGGYDTYYYYGFDYGEGIGVWDDV